MQVVIKNLKIDRNKKFLLFSHQYLASLNLNAASLVLEEITILLTVHSQYKMLLHLWYKKETRPRQLRELLNHLEYLHKPPK